MFIYQKTPQYYETDQMGIIHHANYLRWFEEARFAYMEPDALFHTLKRNDCPIISPVLSAEIKYIRMVRMSDNVEILTRMTQYNGFRYTFVYLVRDKDTDETCCTGVTTHCFLTRDGQPARMKRDFTDLHNLMRKRLEDDTEEELNKNPESEE